MEERRKSKRVPIKSIISVQSLYQSGSSEPVEIKSDIIVTNISKTGIGFISDEDFPEGVFFNSKLVIDNEKYFYCVLKVVRSNKINNGYNVGCEFVGLADVLSSNIDNYMDELD